MWWYDMMIWYDTDMALRIISISIWISFLTFPPIPSSRPLHLLSFFNSFHSPLTPIVQKLDQASASEATQDHSSALPLLFLPLPDWGVGLPSLSSSIISWPIPIPIPGGNGNGIPNPSPRFEEPWWSPGWDWSCFLSKAPVFLNHLLCQRGSSIRYTLQGDHVWFCLTRWIFQ